MMGAFPHATVTRSLHARPIMSAASTAPQILDREFLGIRARLIELAAALDRIDRAAGRVATDPRMEKIRRGLMALSQAGPDRAEQVQMAFSLPYEEGWREKSGAGR
jgi:hypothetical protein